MSRPAPPTFLPSPETLHAAERLERHVEWHEGFWLAYVLTSSPPQVHILQERLRTKLQARGRGQRVLRPDTPEALERILADVLADPHTGCTWVEAVRTTEAVASVEAVAWSGAWGRFVLRANERRELVRGTLEGGLVLAAHLDLKNEIRNAGPDLWSIRSFVFELPPGPRDGPVASKGAEGAIRVRSDFADPGLLESDLRRLPQALQGLDDAARVRIKEKLARRLQASGRHTEAVGAWREVVDIHRTLAQQQPEEFLPSLAAALRKLGDELSSTSRDGEAERAYEEAITIGEQVYGTREHGEVAAALHGLADARARQARYAEAEDAYKEAIAIFERLHQTRERDDVAAALHGLSDALAAQGRHAEAEQAYEDSIAVGGSIFDDVALVDELARVLSDEGDARLVARRAGFSPGQLPAFRSSLVFWSTVVEAARNGALQGGVQPIIDVAAMMFPGNAVFARHPRT